MNVADAAPVNPLGQLIGSVRWDRQVVEVATQFGWIQVEEMGSDGHRPILDSLRTGFMHAEAQLWVNESNEGNRYSARANYGPAALKYVAEDAMT